MSLPPGFLDELRNRTSLAQVVGRKVLWDQRKSQQGKGDMWAPCPFHQEKSASFHVDDRKGFYYCFGCHAKGDAVSFVRETENVGFMEAIEILAREAGLPMPERDPLARQKTDRRASLAEVMEAAVRFYRLQLNTGGGAAARAYITKRKLSAESQARFEIGFAPDNRTALWQHLSAQGVAGDLILDAGLAAVPDGGGSPYDRFRDRIIFPIRDPRGRCIGLGGRAMAVDAKSKYLNSPETELFDKGRSLYNQGPAREAAGKGQPLIVAEGYMDTIALVEAGFGATVAPLGTAITEDQLRLMWRISPEPIIALDGDSAGLRAAMRLIDLALPVLEAGQSLRFCMLPQGQDPDDVIRSQGAAAMTKLLQEAVPMVSLLWQRETEGKVFDSPERKAMLDKTLRAVIATIKDTSIRAHYGDEIKQLRWELFGTRKPAPRQSPRRDMGRDMGRSPGQWQPGQWKPGQWQPEPLAPLSSTKSSLLGAATGHDVEERLREAIVLAIIIRQPDLIAQFEAVLERLVLPTEDHDTLRQAILRHAGAETAETFRAELAEDAGPALARLMSHSHVLSFLGIRQKDRGIRQKDRELAVMELAECLAKLEARAGVPHEIRDAMTEMEGLADEGLTWRVSRAAESRRMTEYSRLDDAHDLGEDRSALSQHLQSLIDGEVWVKKTR